MLSQSHCNKSQHLVVKSNTPKGGKKNEITVKLQLLKGVKQFAVVSETLTFHISLFTFPPPAVCLLHNMARIVKWNVMQAAAFTDCIYIPFADSICPLPGPVIITTVEKNAGSGIKKT